MGGKAGREGGTVRDEGREREGGRERGRMKKQIVRHSITLVYIWQVCSILACSGIGTTGLWGLAPRAI